MLLKTKKNYMGGSASKTPEEKVFKEALPMQNFQMNNISSKSKGFHILELHTPMLGNGVGLLMTVIIIVVVLLVYRKRLSNVK